MREVFLVQVARWTVLAGCIEMPSDAGNAKQLATSITKFGFFGEMRTNLASILLDNSVMILSF
jgi:hypothetical protein